MNVLYYFNENYQENLGGVLHLLDSETKTVEKMVYPRRNTLLCFLTDDLSFHGVSINNENFFRRSFNIYFYTRTPLNSSQSFQPHKTLWISEVEKHDH
jgi:Rps23 Pro-64 3,4-dihydroxylase Tpa1-like proline 4-hydroxylase